ncbi:MAG: virulence factor SrfC family protein, partial [Rhodospirillaceae bacterium]
MASEDQQLADYCGVLQQAVLDGIGWFESNAPRLRQDTSGLVREMRRFAVEARRLDQAAERKVSVGVFGPSQAGKSYLISALARRGSAPLMADFGGAAKDFLAEINPPGGTESTGLVTRFTMDRPAD